MILPDNICVASRKIIINESWEWESLETLFGQEILNEIRYGGNDTPLQKFKFELKIKRITK